ncbi:MAG: PilZ domain-containing protein [Pirellulales bacterium]
MLDLSQEQNLIDVAWEKVELKTRLPENMEDFFDQLGLMPHRSGCRRAYQRFFMRAKAILRWQDTVLGVYSADASRQGIRFLSPVALLPKQRARIRLPNTKEFQIEIVRCHRMDEACYDCGAVFVLGH